MTGRDDIERMLSEIDALSSEDSDQDGSEKFDESSDLFGKIMAENCNKIYETYRTIVMSDTLSMCADCQKQEVNCKPMCDTLDDNGGMYGISMHALNKTAVWWAAENILASPMTAMMHSQYIVHIAQALAHVAAIVGIVLQRGGHVPPGMLDMFGGGEGQ